MQQVDTGEHLLADHGVLLHAAALVLVQPAGLLEDDVGDRDLAEVVEEEPVLDPLVAASQGGIDRGQQLERVTLHALRVRAGLHVLPLESGRERGNGLQVRRDEERTLLALEREQMAEVARVEQHFLHRLGGPRAGLRDVEPPPGQALDGRE